jgi:electron transport complex protein RnfB
MADGNQTIDRRSFVADGARVLGAVGLLGLGGALAVRKAGGERLVWQLDPEKCIACDKCQTQCVLDVSAVKAVQCFALCGYCDVCTGYFPTKDFVLETGAENQLCPTGAITRTFIEHKGSERFFEYTINEQLCIGCGKCVLGCRLMNGSLYLQVRHDRCKNCNECAIAVACPAECFSRVSASSPNLLRKAARDAEAAQQRKRTERPAPQTPAVPGKKGDA